MDSKEVWRRLAGITLRENDNRVEFIKCDLEDIKSVQEAANQIRQKTVRLHIVICNAGMKLSFTISIYLVNKGHHRLSTVLERHGGLASIPSQPAKC